MTPKLYRIYTENRENVVGIAGKYFRNLSVFSMVGSYAGIPEQSMVVEVLTDLEREPLIMALAKEIKETNQQHSVLVLRQDVEYAGSI